MIPLIIGAAAAIVGNIIAANARRKQQKILDEQQQNLNAEKAEDKNFYNSEYYKNQLDRTENSAALQRANEFFKQRTAQDAKTAAITGATPEAVAANKANYLNAYSNLVGNIAAGASNARDRIRANYQGSRLGTDQMQLGLSNSQIGMLDNTVQSGSQLAGAGASLIGSNTDWSFGSGSSAVKPVNQTGVNTNSLKSSYQNLYPTPQIHI